MGCESFDVVRLHLGPLLQGQIRVAKVLSACLLTKNAVYLLIIIYLQPFQILKWRKVYGSHI